MSSLLIGIDCGGTRSTVSLRDPSGDLPDVRRQVPASLSGLLPATAYAATLDALLLGVEPLVPTGRTATLFVAAAAYTPASRGAMVEAFGRVVPQRLGGAIRVAGVANDSGALLLGHDADAVLIAGTGSNVLLRDRDGAFHQVGGQEWVVADEGSGFWIGLRGLRRAFADHRDGVDSVLRRRLLEHLGVDDLHDGDDLDDDAGVFAAVRDLAVAAPEMKRDVAAFAAVVCATAAGGDAAAQEIVRAEAGALAGIVASATGRHLAGVDVPTLVQCGGILADDLVRRTIEDRVAAEVGPVSWIRVPDGAQATLALAGRLAEDGARGFADVPSDVATAIEL